MIYTITFNPAVDLVINVSHVTLGQLNRSTNEAYVAGGKGVNMSVMLKRLGIDNTAVLFLGGFSGEFVQQNLKNKGIATKVITVDEPTRINVKLKSEEETEFNANGAYVSLHKFKELIRYFSDVLTKEDTVFLAGNKAPGITEQHYAKIAQLCQEKGARLVLDTTGTLLTQCLMYQPFIVKPNHHELGELFEVTISSVDDVIVYAKKLQQLGAQNVLVSRGKDGALLLTRDGNIYVSGVPEGNVVNAVGAGDAMLAGFMANYLTTYQYDKALMQGVATGSATAFSIGVATKELVEQLLPHVNIISV